MFRVGRCSPTITLIGLCIQVLRAWRALPPPVVCPDDRRHCTRRRLQRGVWYHHPDRVGHMDIDDPRTPNPKTRP